jgi:hypothetical protein
VLDRLTLSRDVLKCPYWGDASSTSTLLLGSARVDLRASRGLPMLRNRPDHCSEALWRGTERAVLGGDIDMKNKTSIGQTAETAERPRRQRLAPGAPTDSGTGVRPPQKKKARAATRARRGSGAPGARTGDRGKEGLIGKRVGHGRENVMWAQDRPEKRRRDQPVDTAEKGRSATDRKAGYGHTARRNTKLNTAGMSYALEDSVQARPSRKSTRGSANRSKPASNLTRRQQRRTQSPQARARARA